MVICKQSHTSPSSRKVKDSPGPETVSRARFEVLHNVFFNITLLDYGYGVELVNGLFVSITIDTYCFHC